MPLFNLYTIVKRSILIPCIVLSFQNFIYGQIPRNAYPAYYINGACQGQIDLDSATWFACCMNGFNRMPQVADIADTQGKFFTLLSSPASQERLGDFESRPGHYLGTGL